MTVRLHRADLPADWTSGSRRGRHRDLGPSVGRDRLCVVQLSRGDGDADVVQIAAGQTSAPNLEKAAGRPEVVKLFHFGRFDMAALCHAFGVMAGARLLHQDRLKARPHLYRPAWAEGPDARTHRRRDQQAAAVLRLGRGR